MLIPRLLDVAAITCLKPTGEIFDPDDNSSDFYFNFKRDAFGFYIEDHHDTESEEVTEKEHVAFLTFWLSMYVFCTRSIQVAKFLRTLAIQLHERRKIFLRKLILGYLYESLNQGVTEMKTQGKSLLVYGPTWLFQFWLIATFKSKLDIFLPED